MLPILLTLVGLSTDAAAASDIEFKTSGPVLIYVDGQQAALTSKLKQRIGGLEPGTHEVRVTGVFGKTLFEAEMDIPDNTLTYAEWGQGQLKVLRTEWLEDVADDEIEETVAEVDDDAEEVEAPIQVVAPEPEEEPPLAVPAEEATADAAAPAEDEVEVEAEDDTDAVAAAPPPPPATPPAPPADEATSLAAPAAAGGRTLTVQAKEGMRIEVVHEGRTVVVVVEDGSFRIVDPNGLELALSGD